MEATEERKTPRYRDKFQLLNQGEQTLYFRLIEAMPALIVLTQVSLSQVFHIRGKGSYLQVNEVGKKSLDFLICRQDFSIVVAIELNGPHHDQEKQKRSDERKREALEEAGIPLMIYYPQKLPEVTEIRRSIAPLIVERRDYEANRGIRIREPLKPRKKPAPQKWSLGTFLENLTQKKR